MTKQATQEQVAIAISIIKNPVTRHALDLNAQKIKTWADFTKHKKSASKYGVHTQWKQKQDQKKYEAFCAVNGDNLDEFVERNYDGV